ncbi:MAG: hypothetical protein ABUL46_05090, partial [Chitinophaga rupis]
MKKALIALLFILPLSFRSHAQTKVFKAVAEGMSSQMKTIIQDDAVVGYLSFTQLEAASEDSFNYKITIM